MRIHVGSCQLLNGNTLRHDYTCYACALEMNQHQERLYLLIKFKNNTVNSEIFARTLFSRNFAYAKFRENKTLAKWQNHSVFY